MHKLLLTTFFACFAFLGTQANAKPLVEQWLDGQVTPPPIPVTYDGPPITIRFSSFLSPQTPIAKVAIRAFARLKEESGGKLIVRPFWNNTLANAAQGGFDAVSSGVADMSSCYSFMSPGNFTLLLGLQLPFLLKHSTPASQAIAKAYPKYFKDEYEARGVYFARSTITPPNQILSKAQPIKAPANMQGLKTWAVGEIPTTVVSNLDATPVPLAPAELYLSAQTGVVDVVPMHDAGVLTFRLVEVAKYRTDANLSANATEYCMNKSTFDKLPPDLKDVFYRWLQLWNHAEAELYFDDIAVKGREAMKAAGVEFYDLSDTERQQWEEALAPVEQAWIKKMEAEGKPATEFLADYRRNYSDLEAKTHDEIFQSIMDEPVDGLVTGYSYTH